MVLERTKQLVEMGRAAADSLTKKAAPQGRYNNAELWILMQGFAGAFYAVWECLHNVELQGNPLLNGALEDWRNKGGRAEYDVKAGQIRRLLSHQGMSYTTYEYMKVEEDWLNDTEHTVLTHVFARQTFADGSSRDVTFDEWAKDIFFWWDRQVRDLEVAYNRKMKRAKEIEEQHERQRIVYEQTLAEKAAREAEAKD